MTYFFLYIYYLLSFCITIEIKTCVFVPYCTLKKKRAPNIARYKKKMLFLTLSIGTWQLKNFSIFYDIQHFVCFITDNLRNVENWTNSENVKISFLENWQYRSKKVKAIYHILFYIYRLYAVNVSTTVTYLLWTVICLIRFHGNTNPIYASRSCSYEITIFYVINSS